MHARGQIAAATCRFVLLVAELDRRETWREWGLRSTAQWLSWKCALGITAAREHVRVGRALQDLPRISAAFAAGRLSYSKVRALTRVADPAREDQLVEFALTATAAQLEQTIRSYERQCGTGAQEQERLEKLRLNLFANADGTSNLAGRFTPEQADLLRAALERAENGCTAHGKRFRGIASRRRARGDRARVSCRERGAGSDRRSWCMSTMSRLPRATSRRSSNGCCAIPVSGST